MALIDMDFALGGGGGTFLEDTISAGVTKTYNNIKEGLFVVLLLTSPNYYLCGIVENGSCITKGLATGFSANYSNGTLTISNTRTSDTYRLEMYYS